MIPDSHLPSDLRAWTKRLVQHYGLRAGVRLGQHFLVDKKVLSAIVAAAQLTPGARVLEVGGGLGVLTLSLMARADRVVVVELDERLVGALTKLGVGSTTLAVLSGDILKIPVHQLRSALGLGERGAFSIVANLPYEITGAFLQRFLWGELVPASMTLLVQREVAERMAASPGQMSLLSLSCQLKSTVHIVRPVPSGCFWPPPRVESALVRLDLRPAAELAAFTAGAPTEFLWRLARIGFSARRKLLLNNLTSALPLNKAELARAMAQACLKLTARAQELAPHDWIALARELEPVLEPLNP